MAQPVIQVFPKVGDRRIFFLFRPLTTAQGDSREHRWPRPQQIGTRVELPYQLPPPGMCLPDITAPPGGTTRVSDTPDGIKRKSSLIVAVSSGRDSRSFSVGSVSRLGYTVTSSCLSRASNSGFLIVC